jgi:hypothetical protein
MTASRIAVPFQSQTIKQTGIHAATTMATNCMAFRGKRRAIPTTKSVAVADTNTEVVTKTRTLSSFAKRTTIRLSSLGGITAYLAGLQADRLAA